MCVCVRNVLRPATLLAGSAPSCSDSRGNLSDLLTKGSRTDRQTDRCSRSRASVQACGDCVRGSLLTLDLSELVSAPQLLWIMKEQQEPPVADLTLVPRLNSLTSTWTKEVVNTGYTGVKLSSTQQWSRTSPAQPTHYSNLMEFHQK